MACPNLQPIPGTFDTPRKRAVVFIVPALNLALRYGTTTPCSTRTKTPVSATAAYPTRPTTTPLTLTFTLTLTRTRTRTTLFSSQASEQARQTKGDTPTHPPTHRPLCYASRTPWNGARSRSIENSLMRHRSTGPVSAHFSNSFWVRAPLCAWPNSDTALAA